jgi:Zn-dependent protease with chaperone function
MRNRFPTKLILILITVPLISFGVAKGIQVKFEDDWHTILERELGEQQAKQMGQLKELSLRNICSNPATASNMEACETYNIMLLAQKATLGAGALGISIICGIALAGYISRTNRKLLLILFRPGLYLTIVTLIILVILHATLAIFSLYFGESALIGRIHVGIIGAIGIGAIIGVATMIKASLGIVKETKMVVIGRLIEKKDNPALCELIEGLAKKIGAVPPQHIVVGLNPNFFVTEADVQCLNGYLTGRTMYLSLLLCRILTLNEVKAIIGHELAHYKGLDTKFSQNFYPIYRGTIDSLNALSESTDEGSSTIALLPAFYILAFFLDSFTVAESNVSRERELIADQVSAQVVGHKHMASALLKVHAYSSLWKDLRNAMRIALKKGKQYINVSSLFFDIVTQNVTPDVLHGLDSKQLPHPTDSHPPLCLRLKALGLSLADIAEQALKTSSDTEVLGLIVNLENLEKELTEVEHALMVESGEVEIGSEIKEE